MSRAAVFTLVTNATTFPWYEANSTDTPQTSGGMFGILQWEETVKDVRPLELVTLWVHDVPGTYDRIRAALTQIEDALAGAYHIPGSDGWTLTMADWRGRSPDLYDDGYKTVTKNTAFTIVARPS